MRNQKDQDAALEEWRFNFQETRNMAGLGWFLIGLFYCAFLFYLPNSSPSLKRDSEYFFHLFNQLAVYAVTGYMIYEFYRSRKIKKSPALIALDPALLPDLARDLYATFQRMELDLDSVIKIDSSDFGRIPRVSEIAETIYLILPLGFVKEYATDPERARAVLAHELAHVKQKDTELLVMTRSFTRVFSVVLPLGLLYFTYLFYSDWINHLDLIDSRQNWAAVEAGLALAGEDVDMEASMAREAENARIQTAIYVRIFFWPFVSLVFVAFYFFSRYIRRRSEYLADLGAAIFATGSGLRSALDSIEPPVGYRKFLQKFSIYPRLAERMSGIARISERYPTLDNPGTFAAPAGQIPATFGRADAFPREEVVPANASRRFATFLIDSFLSWIPAYILLGAATKKLADPFIMVLMVILLFFVFLYYFIFETYFQKTPGKWITRTKVTTPMGRRPSGLTVFWRTILRVGLCGIDALSFLGRSKPIGLHDRISQTRVVDDRKPRSRVSNPGGDSPIVPGDFETGSKAPV